MRQLRKVSAWIGPANIPDTGQRMAMTIQTNFPSGRLWCRVCPSISEIKRCREAYVSICTQRQRKLLIWPYSATVQQSPENTLSVVHLVCTSPLPFPSPLSTVSPGLCLERKKRIPESAFKHCMALMSVSTREQGSFLWDGDSTKLPFQLHSLEKRICLHCDPGERQRFPMAL